MSFLILVESINIQMLGRKKKKKSPEVIELIPELQITTNNWQLSQLNTEPCTLPYTILTMVLL